MTVQPVRGQLSWHALCYTKSRFPVNLDEVKTMLTVCCVCKRAKKQEAWADCPGESGPELISHGYCPECFSALMAELSESLPGWGKHCAHGTQAAAPASFAVG